MCIVLPARTMATIPKRDGIRLLSTACRSDYAIVTNIRDVKTKCQDILSFASGFPLSHKLPSTIKREVAEWLHKACTQKGLHIATCISFVRNQRLCLSCQLPRIMDGYRKVVVEILTMCLSLFLS